MKTPKGRWAQHHIATLLGIEPTMWSKLLNGQMYPARLQLLQKIEFVFGWPVSEQVQLIPPYWEWPETAAAGKPQGEPTDLRYAMKLARVVAEWADANPRTVSTKELGLHPNIKPINKRERPPVVKAEEEPQEEPLAPRPLTLNRNPLVKR